MLTCPPTASIRKRIERGVSSAPYYRSFGLGERDAAVDSIHGGVASPEPSRRGLRTNGENPNAVRLPTMRRFRVDALLGDTLPPIPMETIRHAMRQLNSCQWLVFNIFRIENKEIAAPLFMTIDNCQQKPFAFHRLRRTRHENGFRRKALGAKVVQLPSAGLVVVAEDGVKEARIDRRTRPSTGVTVA